MPTLKITPPPGMTTEEGTGAFRAAVDGAIQTFRNGFSFKVPPPSDRRGELHRALTDYDDNELGNLLFEKGEYCGWVEETLALRSAERMAAEADYEFVKSSVRLEYKEEEDSKGKPKKLQVDERKDRMNTDPRVIKAYQNFIFHDALFQLTEAHLKDSQRIWSSISRRITQRGQDVERMKRESNIAGVSVVAHNAFRRD